MIAERTGTHMTGILFQIKYWYISIKAWNKAECITRAALKYDNNLLPIYHDGHLYMYLVNVESFVNFMIYRKSRKCEMPIPRLKSKIFFVAYAYVQNKTKYTCTDR